MQALIELLIGFIALLAAAALSPFGVDLKTAPKAEQEIHRVSDCRQAPSSDHSRECPNRRPPPPAIPAAF